MSEVGWIKGKKLNKDVGLAEVLPQPNPTRSSGARMTPQGSSILREGGEY